MSHDQWFWENEGDAPSDPPRAGVNGRDGVEAVPNRIARVAAAITPSQGDPSTWPFGERPGGKEWTERCNRCRAENIRRRAVEDTRRASRGQAPTTWEEWQACPGHATLGDV